MKQIGRREFLNFISQGAAMGVAAGICPSLSFGQISTKRPNILYIMTDDHARHALSCYGSRVNKTPNMDRIAHEGMRFDNSFVTNSICAPCRAVLLTGKFSHINGHPDNRATFDGSQMTFPKLLGKAGYQTAMIGKWHLKSDPTGFDYWDVLPGQGRYHNPVMIEMGTRKKLEGYVTDIITDKTIKYIEERDKSKPFCVLCHHKAPHRNWQPDEKHAHMYMDEIPEPETFNDDYSHRASPASNTQMTLAKHFYKGDYKLDPPEGLTPQERKKWNYQRYMQDYLRCIASVDDNIGRLLDYLDKSGLADNTVVIYTSDQGFYLGDHGWYDKRFMYEESLTMPLMMRYPPMIKPGSVNDNLVQNLDFAPTILDLAGVKVPRAMQGESMKPIMAGNPPDDWRKSIYYHYYEWPAVHMVRRHYGVRTDRYKLIHYYHQQDEWELFDLKKDPNELHSYYNDPSYADIQHELKIELARLRSYYRDHTGVQSSHLDFDIVYDAEVEKSGMGHKISTSSDGYALNKTSAPIRSRATFRFQTKTLKSDGQRNALFAFGPDNNTVNMLKCGLYIGVQEHVVLYGRFTAKSKKEIIRKEVKYDQGKTFDVEVTVDLDAQTISMSIDGETMSAPIKKDIKEINYYGCYLHGTTSAFSQIEVKGA
jgi:arylsulfatase A-like enzyme